MLKPGDKIKITTSENGGLGTGGGWTVLQYDNGLLKVETLNGTRTIFNMRSVNFHSVEYES